MFALAHAAYIREKARQLRRDKKLTVDELAERLALSRTTVYYWVRDLPIPGSGSGGGWPESARRKGNRAMQEKYRRLREAAYEEGLISTCTSLKIQASAISSVSTSPRGTSGTAMRFRLPNSDQAVIHAAVRWMRMLSARRLNYSVQYHADQDLNEIRRFWAGELGVEPEEIRLQRKSNSSQLASRTWRCKHGVLTVRTSDTYFREELQAWVDCLRDSWLDSNGVGA
jgi:excisionase family DNA binding protein